CRIHFASRGRWRPSGQERGHAPFRPFGDVATRWLGDAALVAVRHAVVLRSAANHPAGHFLGRQTGGGAARAASGTRRWPGLAVSRLLSTRRTVADRTPGHRLVTDLLSTTALFGTATGSGA